MKRQWDNRKNITTDIAYIAGFFDGFNGYSLDASYDECHHVLSMADAEIIIKSVNNHYKLVQALKNILIQANHSDDYACLTESYIKAQQALKDTGER